MVYLASAWAERYMKRYPNIDISVTGGGSGTGIAALQNGTTDICMSSFQITPKIFNNLNIDPYETVAAKDGIAVLVHPENPVKVLTIEQLRKIFSGAYRNWSSLGGPNQEILVLSRETSSGTYVFFQDIILNKADYTQDALLLPSTSSIINAAAQDKWSIGYAGLGYALEAESSISVIEIQIDAESAPVKPSIESVKTNAYPASRPLYLYTHDKPAGEVKKFIEFCISPEGQEIVLSAGFISI